MFCFEQGGVVSSFFACDVASAVEGTTLGTTVRTYYARTYCIEVYENHNFNRVVQVTLFVFIVHVPFVPR
jgi:hypothetical protein